MCFRRDNKIGIVCQVTPILTQSVEVPHVRIAFGLKHFTYNQTSETAHGTITETSNTIMQKVYIDFGPLRIEDGLKVIPRPKYIDDCLSNTTTLVKAQ